MKNLSVILVDDHKLFREGLCLLLKNLDFIEEVREAANGEAFLDLSDYQKADIIFMDVDMPVMNGIDATTAALRNFPDLNIIALSMHGDEEFYLKMMDAGAKGFLLKNSGIQELEMAMEHVLSAKSYFSQDILAGLLRNVNRKKNKTQNTLLSEREEEVLYQICKGFSNQEIADILHISKRTVDKHRENLLFKTNTKNTAGMVMFAIKNGVVEV